MDPTTTLLALLGVAVFFALMIVLLNPERWYTDDHLRARDDASPKTPTDAPRGRGS